MVQFEQNGTYEVSIQKKRINWGYNCLLVPQNKKRRVSNIGYLNPHVIMSFSENTNTENMANEILIEQGHCKCTGIFILNAVLIT